MIDLCLGGDKTHKGARGWKLDDPKYSIHLLFAVIPEVLCYLFISPPLIIAERPSGLFKFILGLVDMTLNADVKRKGKATNIQRYQNIML